jgi:hypothetical protein
MKTKLIIFALLAIMVSCKKDEITKPELIMVCEMFKFPERRITNLVTGIRGNWTATTGTPIFYSKNCGDEGKIIPSSTHNPVGQIIETRYVVRRK